MTDRSRHSRNIGISELRIARRRASWALEIAKSQNLATSRPQDPGISIIGASKSRNAESATSRGYEAPKHQNIGTPHIEIMRSRCAVASKCQTSKYRIPEIANRRNIGLPKLRRSEISTPRNLESRIREASSDRCAPTSKHRSREYRI